MDAPSLSYRRFVDNVLAGGSARVAAIVTALALATVLVRVLGLSAYGTWAFFFVLIGYHGQFDLGLSVAVERAVARAAGRGDPRASTCSSTPGGDERRALRAAPGAGGAAAAGHVAGARRRGGRRARLRARAAGLSACSNVAAVAGAGLTGLQRTTTLALQRT